MHVALRFAYDGPSFEGYARQPDHRTVEDTLIEALGREGYVACSWRTGSRTDRGVSALENVARAELDRPHLRGLLPAVNRLLPDGLWLTGVAPVAPEWNPRHGKQRTYQYVQPRGGEDLDAMKDACKAFVGTHPMHAFARIDERDPVRTVHAFDVAPGEDAWRFTVTGPSFLWNQVRRMVAAVLDVGAGRLDVAAIAHAFVDGQPVAQLAPPEGLLLAAVDYDPELVWADAGHAPKVGRAWQRAQVQATLLNALSESS